MLQYLKVPHQGSRFCVQICTNFIGIVDYDDEVALDVE